MTKKITDRQLDVAAIIDFARLAWELSCDEWELSGDDAPPNEERERHDQAHH